MRRVHPIWIVLLMATIGTWVTVHWTTYNHVPDPHINFWNFCLRF